MPWKPRADTGRCRRSTLVPELSSEQTKSAVEPCSVLTTSNTFFASYMKRAAFGDCEPGGWEGQVGMIDGGDGACEVC
jgi:hypothetical protein